MASSSTHHEPGGDAPQPADGAKDGGGKSRDRRPLVGIGALFVIGALVLAFACVQLFGRDGAGARDGGGAGQTQQRTGARDARTRVAAVRDAPKRADGEGGFVFSRDGIGRPVEGRPTVALYLDFMCPGCGELDRALAPSLESMARAGQINLEIHANGFLDPLSTDAYSTRAAAAWAYVAEHDPDHALAYMQALYDPAFQPQEGGAYHPVTDGALAARAESAGVPHGTAQAAVKGKYRAWIKALAAYTPLRPSLQHPDGRFKGEMTTPTVTVNGRYWSFDGVADDSALPAALAGAIGLDPGSVGDPAAVPSLKPGQGPIVP